jgi:hypothetical protein
VVLRPGSVASRDDHHLRVAGLPALAIPDSLAALT